MASSVEKYSEDLSHSVSRSTLNSVKDEAQITWRELKEGPQVTLHPTQRNPEFSYLDEGNHVYLDYTGAALAGRTQYERQVQRLKTTLCGNPHSPSPASLSSTKLVEDTRRHILRFLNASPDEYMVVFTPNASGAARLVGEAYPFKRWGKYVLLNDNHNSINGIRQYAHRCGTETKYVAANLPDLRVSEDRLKEELRSHRGLACLPISTRGDNNLFAYPAQSNFAGVKHPLKWVSLAQKRGYRVLLDAAAFLPTNPIDLRVVRPDYMIMSWYKVFGFPTGIGCLVMKKEAAALLKRPWFSGGTVQAVSVGIPWHKMSPDEAKFEDGTLNFLSIPDVSIGLEWIESIGIRQIQRHVRSMTEYCLLRLKTLIHSDGSKMIKVYGPQDTRDRGGTIAFNIIDAAKNLVDERIVAREAARNNLNLRTGCFCNPGVGEDLFELSFKGLWSSLLSKDPTFDEYINFLGLPTAGAIRVSFGIPTVTGDIDKLIDHLENTYMDRFTSSKGLPPRGGC